MKAIALTVKILLVCVPCSAFAQALGTAATSDFYGRSMRLSYASEQEGGGAIYELSQAYVRVDQDHVFHAAAATARVGKAPLGETVITAQNGIVVNETSPEPTMHLTSATLVWDPTKSIWDVGAEHTFTDCANSLATVGSTALLRISGCGVGAMAKYHATIQRFNSSL